MNHDMITDAFELAEPIGAQDDADDLYNSILDEIGLQGMQ